MNDCKNGETISVAGAAFTLVGSVMGAGFLSGRELLDFFGGFYLPSVLFAFAAFVLCFWLLFSIGASCGGFEGALKSLPPILRKGVRLGVLFGSFFTCVGMLSAMRAAFPKAGILLPFIALLAAAYIGEKGLGGLEKASVILTPVALIAVLFLVWKNGALSLPEKGKAWFAFPLFYVTLNAFFSLPVLLDIGGRMSGKKRAASAFLSGAIIAFFIGFILSALAADKNCYCTDLPLAAALKKGKTAFSFLAFLGMATTLFSCFYPVYTEVKTRWRKTGRMLLFVFCLLGSIVGFKKIVGTVYPVLSFLGAGIVVLFFIAWGIKRKKNRGG